MNSLGFTTADLQKGNMALIYGLGYMLSAFIAYRMYRYAGHLDDNLSPFPHGFYHGAVSGGMIAIPVLILNSLFERKSWANILINAGYWLLALGLIGGICYTLHPPDLAG